MSWPEPRRAAGSLAKLLQQYLAVDPGQLRGITELATLLACRGRFRAYTPYQSRLEARDIRRGWIRILPDRLQILLDHLKRRA